MIFEPFRLEEDDGGTDAMHRVSTISNIPDKELSKPARTVSKVFSSPNSISPQQNTDLHLPPGDSQK